MWNSYLAWLSSLPPGAANFVGTLTGSFLGFIALLLGALFNARLNRKRDDALREADRKAIVSALRAELGSIQMTLIGNADRVKSHPPTPGDGFVVPDISHSVKVFPHVLPKIGLLNGDSVRRVVDAYVLVEQYSEGLILLGGALRQDMPEGRRVIYLDADRADWVAQINRERAEFIDCAIRTLDKSA
jgi:hypothetical protein